jgi:SAM-dependent methyltransferase
MSILIFPSALEASVRFAEDARQRGARTIGASSLEVDPNAAKFDAWVRLPFIGDERFFSDLERVVIEHGIDALYTPHAPSFHLLEQQLPLRLPALRLVGDGPFKRQMRKVQAGVEEARSNLAVIDGFAGRTTEFPVTLLAGLLAQVDEIHGECSREKILALCGIMPDAPKGDIVEIGCLYGKSSYILNRLGAHFDIGATLAVDAWNLELSVQHDAPMNIQKASGGWDWEIVYQGFLINMLGCSAAPFNYLRATSAQAHRHYRDARSVSSLEFGSTTFAGDISLLHIDGNHDEAAVEEDFQLWSPHLTAGGWIVFDDYNWPHGAGPRVVADRALRRFGGRVERHFVGGGALFMKISR